MNIKRTTKLIFLSSMSGCMLPTIAVGMNNQDWTGAIIEGIIVIVLIFSVGWIAAAIEDDLQR